MIAKLAHFLNVAKMKSSDKSQFDEFKSTMNQETGKKTGRTRKTEKEEDDEMLNNAEMEEEASFTFEESPACINLFTRHHWRENERLSNSRLELADLII